MAAVKALPMLLLLTLPACSATIHLTSAWNTRSAAGLEAHTGTELVLLECPRGVDSLHAELTVQCRAGALQVQLQDPAGVTCFADTLRGGERQCALRLPASTGVCAVGSSSPTSAATMACGSKPTTSRACGSRRRSRPSNSGGSSGLSQVGFRPRYAVTPPHTIR